MRLRQSQFDALAAATLDAGRRDRLLSLRDRGYDVEEDRDRAVFNVRDRSGGSIRVESRGLIVRSTTAEGRTTETEQYPNGRIRRIVDAAGTSIRFERDKEGFLKSIDRGRDGGVFRFVLNADWQPLRVDYPDGTSSTTEYAPNGAPTR